MSSSAGGSQKNLKVDITLHGKKEGQELPPRQAYLFDSAGRLVEVHSVTDGPVTFGIQAGQRYQVVVGPQLISDGGKAPPDLMAQLTKAGAMRKDYLPELNQDSLVFPIYPPIWLCWWKTCILVHGTVRKLLNPGGTPAQYAPICTGTVQIFQVDLGCTLDKLASFELTNLRDRLVSRLTVPLQALEASRQVINRPVPPGPPPESQGTRSAPQQIGNRTLMAATRAGVSPGAGTTSFSEVATTLATLDGSALKQYIIAQKVILFPFWCELIPDDWFCWQELGEAPLQSDGSFSAEVCFWCPADFPDLYFEVVQNLGGIESEIYDPQIACSTYYNYDGSQSVDIVVDDPAAVACLPDPNPGPSYLYVWPTAIGNVDLKYIDGLETGVGTGLVASSSPWDGSPIQAPWGGTLDLQMQFHPGLQASNILYYRWSYLFDGDSTPTPIIPSVTHRYKTIAYIPGPPPQIIIQLHSVTLGPQTVGGTSGLFAIPDPTLDWIDIDDPADRPFAYFDTGSRSGMCTLILEMFDNTGKFVPCNNALGTSTIGDQPSDAPSIPFTYILPQIGGPPNTYTNAPTPNITHHGRLVFRLRVDNNPTTAALPDVRSGAGSTDACGFLEYGALSDHVYIDYIARHPNNFISWSLGVVKGLSGTVASDGANTNAPAAPPPPPASLDRTAGVLLGSCVRAAFAVNLYCWAWTTDGYSRQLEYDRSATIAFALTPSS